MRSSARRRKPRERPSLDEAIARIRKSRSEELALVDVIALTETTIGTLQDVFEVLDETILREFGAIASSIARAKNEIGRLQPREVSHKRIPQAGRELAAIVEATEQATHDIMAAAERMLAIEADDLDAFRTKVEAEAMSIFEACSFQDITGQRVSKVVETLEDIDERMARFAATIGVADLAGQPSSRESARDARNRKLILHGPALAGDGIGQGEVDRLMQSESGGPGDQGAIDDMFD